MQVVCAGARFLPQKNVHWAGNMPARVCVCVFIFVSCLHSVAARTAAVHKEIASLFLRMSGSGNYFRHLLLLQIISRSTDRHSLHICTLNLR